MKVEEIVVVGAGPAGLAAAISAAEAGARVTLVDDNPGAGGQIWRHDLNHPAGGSPAKTWFERLRIAKIPTLVNAQVISGDARSRTLLVETPEKVLQLHFENLILATGARELFLPFPGWTLPGVVGVGGLQALVKSGLPIAGKRVVIGGTGPLLLAVAAYLSKKQARVRVIAEQASRRAVAGFALGLIRHPAKLAQATALQWSLSGIAYRFGCWITAAEGRSRVESVRLRQGDRIWTEPCDFAAVAYGLLPNVELASLLGCSIDGPAVTVNEHQESSAPGIFCAGECTGIGGVDLALAEGSIAGYAAAGRSEDAARWFRKRRSARAFAEHLNRAFALRPELKELPNPDTLVCRCEDVPFEHLQGFPSFRAAKLHTRCGMGPCQGRICGPAAEFLLGWRPEPVRPPIFPARIGSLSAQRAMQERAITST